MNRIRRFALVVSGVLMLTAVTACGSSSSGGTGAGTGSGTVSPDTVVIKNFAFSPASLSVPVGTKVKFINEDSVTHTATGSGASAAINSGDLKNGQSYTVTFTKAGTYSYICSIHPYMKGTVVVH